METDIVLRSVEKVLSLNFFFSLYFNDKNF